MQLNKKRGASLLGYGLIVGLIGVVAIAAITGTGDSVRALFDQTSDTLETAALTGSGGASESASPSSTPDDRATTIYVTTATTDAAFGGRSGGDSFCVANKPAAVDCDGSTIRAFMTVSSSDSHSNMPANYDFRADLPLSWANSTTGALTQFGADWSVVDDPADITVNQQTGIGVSGGGDYNVWSGRVVSDLTCSGWTNNSTSVSNGLVGLQNNTTAFWIRQGLGNCGNFARRLRCACKPSP
ncbi:MAG: hypothetical protein Alpg2KO_33150 [Alphaproteobacteria bacterium]